MKRTARSLLLETSPVLIFFFFPAYSNPTVLKNAVFTAKLLQAAVSAMEDPQAFLLVRFLWREREREREKEIEKQK
jgi:hypothetical protein